MSFRQFPATDSEGNSYIVIEFHDDRPGPDGKPSLRYELLDGMPLKREGKQFSTPDGSLVLTQA
ncbi:hypothetical protein [Pseudoxanthomonas taiwanensis]|jgi:hypothetical protein|uniref:Uncharacterized protein n=1 Tax=Pseudoxanthomonas taiwanensis TaxID=176598 RepID=A0A921TGG3_9GAMM|nr:hypothetical protein [Pseudoxanthomonas taiwanensis]KAF1689536.1 hypothetical protein CR938_05445 [Pseudoxanthomonas taiwanensis]MBO2466892.1 hypothetical protein [Xanthomonadaceae bacterium]